MRTGTTVPEVDWNANGYRLPTEAEWEKAARGGVSGKRFPWGTDTISHSNANFRNGGGESYQIGTTGYHPTYGAGTSPVGSFEANGYGLYDMAGNVGEGGESTAFTVTFAPDAGASGTRTATLQVASNDVDENPFDIALSGEAYSTTHDLDNDGMNDWGEYKLSALGFDWQVPNNALVSTYYDNAGASGLYNQTLYNANRAAGQNDVINSPNTYSLYTLSQVQALSVGTPLLQRDPSTGEFTLTIGVDQSTNLTNWAPLPMTVPQTIINSQGKVEFRFTTPNNAAFFRLQTQPTP